MNTPLYVGFDIECAPRLDLVERFAKPFPDFDPNAVKTGNIKDPVKIAEKVNQAKADHEAERTAYWANLRERAALDPFTGEILCIGTITHTGAIDIIAEKTEAATIRQFWQLVSLPDASLTKFVFWSGCGDVSRKFDIDYIVTRSRILGVPVPSLVRNGRYYASRFVDLAGEFLLHQRDRYLSLTRAADLFGLYGPDRGLVAKRDDDPVTGANFFQWWKGEASNDHSLEQQRDFACIYLKNDLRHLVPLAQRIL